MKQTTIQINAVCAIAALWILALAVLFSPLDGCSRANIIIAVVGAIAYAVKRWSDDYQRNGHSKEDVR